MKKAIITLPESTKDRNILLMKRYQFINGEMSVPILSDNCTNHQKIGGLLSKYYGCTVEIVYAEDSDDGGETDAAKEAAAEEAKAIKEAAEEEAKAIKEAAKDEATDSPEAKPAKAEPAKAATAKATAKSPEA